MLNPNVFCAETFNIFYIFGREKISTSPIRAPIKQRKFPIKHVENPIKHVEFSTCFVLHPLYGAKKEERTPCLGLFPLRYYKDNTFLREMQIALTFRNIPSNVKRRVLHKRGSPMYYITREPEATERHSFFNPAFLPFSGNVKVSFQGNVLHVACGSFNL